MKWIYPLVIALALTACKKEEKVTILSPVYNQTDRELSCDNQPAMVKECVDVQMCGKFGEDVMNYTFCSDQCLAEVRKKCRKPKAAPVPPQRITAPMPLQQMPTPDPVRKAQPAPQNPLPSMPAPQPMPR